MLFNSYQFIFLFLPIMVLGFYFLGTHSRQRYAMSWLVLGSLFFYGWWNPPYIILILFSISFNYFLTRYVLQKTAPNTPKRIALVVGVSVNLGLLGYFKYSNFFLENLNAFGNTSFHISAIILPIGISFFTFQQIAFLVDSYKGKIQECDFLRYSLFVTFFPQLIAGPIVHHQEMLPQFNKKTLGKFGCSHFAIGLTIFLMGLFKKVVIADGVAGYSTPVFDAARDGMILTFFEAWGGALAFTLQLYFDFSGYSDMAIGLGRMFGFRLPVNFYSPYKAENIVEFWRRWHMTLSRFFRDYLYIPMGGSHKGSFRHLGNLFITMVLVGFWHGAGWTYLVWGALHGVLLLVNHGWQKVKIVIGVTGYSGSLLTRIAARGTTFFCVVIGWVYFRAENLSSAHSLLYSMFGGNGLSLPNRLSGKIGLVEDVLLAQGVTFQGMFSNSLTDWNWSWIWFGGLLCVVWFAPNTQQIFSRSRPALNTYPKVIQEQFQSRIQWNPSPSWALVTAAVGIIACFSLTNISEFLYFQF